MTEAQITNCGGYTVEMYYLKCADRRGGYRAKATTESPATPG
jgi:hypothetical protein